MACIRTMTTSSNARWCATVEYDGYVRRYGLHDGGRRWEQVITDCEDTNVAMVDDGSLLAITQSGVGDISVFLSEANDRLWQAEARKPSAVGWVYNEPGLGQPCVWAFEEGSGVSLFKATNGERLSTVPRADCVHSARGIEHKVLSYRDESWLTCSLQHPRERQLTRHTFGVLSVAFAGGLVFLSEWTGPLSAHNLVTGCIEWVHSPDEGWHFLDISVDCEQKKIRGVCFNYAAGDGQQLVTIDCNSGEVDAVVNLPRLGAEMGFADAGRLLVTMRSQVLQLPDCTEVGHLEGCA